VGSTVLLVDDDEAVREIGRAYLERAGFRVLTAEGGFAALERLRNEGDAVDLVVLDLAMPDLSGEETFEALRKLRSDLPVVLASGYDRKQASERFRVHGIGDFVRKPYEPEDLIRSIGRALGRSEDGDREAHERAFARGAGPS
jgi:CheY-like chemotaxis protein